MIDRRSGGSVPPEPPGAPSLLEEILDEHARRPPDEPEGAKGGAGLDRFIERLQRDAARDPAIDVGAIDAEIARIDAVLTAQVNEILHHPDLRRLEAAWRSVMFLVDRTEFDANIQIEILSVTKGELQDDLCRGEALSRLHDIVRWGIFERGESHPYSLLIVDHAFGSSAEDIVALERLATLAARAHAQCLAAPAPSLLGLSSWRDLPGWCRRRYAVAPGAPEVTPATEHYARWRALRESDASLHLSLCLPRFQLRPRYGAATAPVRLFPFEETAGDGDASPLWGSAAIVAAAAICDGFAEVGWHLPRLWRRAMRPDTSSTPTTGESNGAIPCEVECALTERGCYVLSEVGLSHIDVAQRGARVLRYAATSYFGSTSIENHASTGPRYLFLYLALVRCIHAQFHALRRQGDAPAEIERALDTWLGRYDRKRHWMDATWVIPRALSFGCAELSVEGGPEGERIASLHLSLSHDYEARPYLHTWSLSSRQPGPVCGLQ